jgi:protein-arginine kinase activator protein McsA
MSASVHILLMDYDISHLLAQWDYQPGQVVVRRFVAKDGKEKIQLRVDLGLLQMNAEGRPDGKRPYGHATLYDYFKAKLHKYVAAHEGSDEGFRLKPEDCAKLQLEAIQFHHRYICLLQLEDYAAVVRDAERNLEVFEFVGRHAETEELAWALRQFQPQLLMILTRARGAQALKVEDYTLAIKLVEEGLETIRSLFRENSRGEADASGEVQSLDAWLEEIKAKRPLSARERLERSLRDAVQSENYEKAAKVRDALKNLKEP